MAAKEAAAAAGAGHHGPAEEPIGAEGAHAALQEVRAAAARLEVAARMPGALLDTPAERLRAAAECGHLQAVRAELPAVRAAGESRPVQHDYDLGSFSSPLPDSNDTSCMLNRQRELTVAHPTVAGTATSSRLF